MQIVLHKLNLIDKRLSKLDSIESKVTGMSQKLNRMDIRITDLERNAHESSKKSWNLKQVELLTAKRVMKSV
jgi:uncharacterized membrane protein